jgi:hypothetical protein
MIPTSPCFKSPSAVPEYDRLRFDDIKDNLMLVGREHGGDLAETYHAKLQNYNFPAEKGTRMRFSRLSWRSGNDGDRSSMIDTVNFTFTC